MTALMILFMGCSSSNGTRIEEAVQPPAQLGRGVTVVLRGDDERRVALGAVIRVTHESALVLAAARADVPGPFRVVLPGDPPAAARILARTEDALLLAVPRAGRDLRPYELAPDAPSPLAQARMLSLRAVGLRPPVLCSVAADPPPGAPRAAGVAWLAAAPPSDDDDDRPAEARAADSEGGLIFDRQGRLLGLLGRPEKGSPRILVAPSVVQRFTDAILSVPGADLVRPDDTLLCYAVRVETVSDLPLLGAEEESGPMLVMEVRIGDELAGRIEVTPGRPRTERLIAARAPGPLTIQLVALDRNLAQGETRSELSKGASFFAIAPRLDVTLPLDTVLDRYPGPRDRRGVVRARLAFEPVDPDRASGLRRTPLLPAPLAPGRPVESTLDLAAGRATEFFTVSDATSEEVVALLYRRRLGAVVELSVFAPGYDGDLVTLSAKDRGPHVAVATGRLLKGRVVARLRQLSGEAAIPCEVLVAPRNDASAVVGPLFRLVNREAAKDGTAFMDSDAFVEEVAEALEKTGLPAEALERAILDELGGRVQVARRLGFCLLERHFVPTRALLEEGFAAGGGLTAPAQDAGLILAELDPREPRIRPVLRRACSDADPYVRARAVRAASRGGDAAFMEEIAASCERDGAPIVERAVAAAKLNASLLRQAERR